MRKLPRKTTSPMNTFVSSDCCRLKQPRSPRWYPTSLRVLTLPTSHSLQLPLLTPQLRLESLFRTTSRPVFGDGIPARCRTPGSSGTTVTSAHASGPFPGQPLGVASSCSRVTYDTWVCWGSLPVAGSFRRTQGYVSELLRIPLRCPPPQSPFLSINPVFHLVSPLIPRLLPHPNLFASNPLRSGTLPCDTLSRTQGPNVG